MADPSDSIRIRLRFPNRSKFARLYERELHKGGLFLKSRKTHPLGTELKVQFLPEGTTLGLELTGQVIHEVGSDEATAMESSPGMGVRFFDLDDDKRLVIEAYVAGRIDDFVLEPEQVEEEKDDVEAEAEPQTKTDGEAQRTLTSVASSKDRNLASDEEEEVGQGATFDGAKEDEIDPATLKELEADLDSITKLLEERANFYELLSIDADATPDEIKSGFLTLKKNCHPDRFTAKGATGLAERATVLYGEINKAYLTVSVPSRRASYNLMIGRYTARYSTKEEEEAHQAVSKEFHRKYTEKFPEKVRKAADFARYAKEQARVGQFNAARNNVKLALTFDPLNGEYRQLLQSLDDEQIRELGPETDRE